MKLLNYENIVTQLVHADCYRGTKFCPALNFALHRKYLCMCDISCHYVQYGLLMTYTVETAVQSFIFLYTKATGKSRSGIPIIRHPKNSCQEFPWISQFLVGISRYFENSILFNGFVKGRSHENPFSLIFRIKNIHHSTEIKVALVHGVCILARMVNKLN